MFAPKNQNETPQLSHTPTYPSTLSDVLNEYLDLRTRVTVTSQVIRLQEVRDYTLAAITFLVTDTFTGVN